MLVSLPALASTSASSVGPASGRTGVVRTSSKRARRAASTSSSVSGCTAASAASRVATVAAALLGHADQQGGGGPRLEVGEGERDGARPARASRIPAAVPGSAIGEPGGTGLGLVQRPAERARRARAERLQEQVLGELLAGSRQGGDGPHALAELGEGAAHLVRGDRPELGDLARDRGDLVLAHAAQQRGGALGAERDEGDGGLARPVGRASPRRCRAGRRPPRAARAGQPAAQQVGDLVRVVVDDLDQAPVLLGLAAGGQLAGGARRQGGRAAGRGQGGARPARRTSRCWCRGGRCAGSPARRAAAACRRGCSGRPSSRCRARRRSRRRRRRRPRRPRRGEGRGGDGDGVAAGRVQADGVADQALQVGLGRGVAGGAVDGDRDGEALDPAGRRPWCW